MDLWYLRIKLKAATAVSQHIDFPLHLLILIQSSLLITMIVQENCKIQVDQRVGSVKKKKRKRKYSVIQGSVKLFFSMLKVEF